MLSTMKDQVTELIELAALIQKRKKKLSEGAALNLAAQLMQERRLAQIASSLQNLDHQATGWPG